MGGNYLRMSSNPSVWDQVVSSFQNIFPAKPEVKAPETVKVDTKIYDAEIDAAKEVLRFAAETKAEDADKVVDSLLSLEKLMRAKAKIDDGISSRETLKNLNGAWRLVFTTGTVDTQKKIGRKINYFPIKAVQSFDTSSMKINNGIYLGDFAVLKFFGDFEWKEKARKLEFDFDSIAVLGLKFDLPKGGAAKIGSQTGLGSEGNVEMAKRGAKPFFNWISADADIATARGGGGGLALWRRDPEMEARNAAEKVEAGEEDATAVEV
jgi:PAP_fibrillin